MLEFFYMSTTSKKAVSRQTRSRTQSGCFQQKRSDTRVGTIEQQYGVNFGVRSDMKLTTLLKKKGLPSMAKVLTQIDKPILLPLKHGS